MKQRTSSARIIIVSALMASLFVTLAPTKAQDGLANNEVLIKNWTKYTVSVKIRNGDSAWSESIPLSPRGELLAKDINQITIEGSTPHKLELKNRYCIEWNESEGFYLGLLQLR